MQSQRVVAPAMEPVGPLEFQMIELQVRAEAAESVARRLAVVVLKLLDAPGGVPGNSVDYEAESDGGTSVESLLRERNRRIEEALRSVDASLAQLEAM